MGYNSLRRLINKECKWTDKSVPKHKHDFSIEACVELKQPNSILYYHVMKCKYCSSFHSIPKDGAVNGYVSTKISNLPLIKLIKSHKTIGFEGSILDINTKF